MDVYAEICVNELPHIYVARVQPLPIILRQEHSFSIGAGQKINQLIFQQPYTRGQEVLIYIAEFK